MALSCGIVGLPITGKTTFFNLLTQAEAETSNFFSGKTSTNKGMAYVPDARIDCLSKVFKPKKTTYAQIEIIDIPGLVEGSSQGQGTGNEFLASVRDVDILAHILRAFNNPDIMHVAGDINLKRDVQIIQNELLLADLQLIETRLNRILEAKGKKRKLENVLEEPVLLKCQAALEEEKPIETLNLSQEEKDAISHITLLTQKPVILVINVDDKQLAAESFPGKDELYDYCKSQGMTPPLVICAQIEEEINQLEPEERATFLTDLGIKTPGINRLAQALYAKLGLISFLTAGEDEVRAWTIKDGLSAKAAAGKIHSDIERGFIRAETVAFADFLAAGSMAGAREKGCFRLEGKEYIVADGDIINFRFNV